MESLDIRPIASDDEIDACARLMASSEPWITLRRDYAASRRILEDSSRERFVAYLNHQFAGLLILNMKGAFVGYIQTICVAPELRGRRLGSALIDFAEQRIFRESANVFMCVSSFNEGARRLYARLGYEVAGELHDYLIKGSSEILLRKTRGPILKC